MRCRGAASLSNRSRLAASPAHLAQALGVAVATEGEEAPLVAVFSAPRGQVTLAAPPTRAA